MASNRLETEIEHGKYLLKKGAGVVWNWESPAGKERWKRRVKMLTDFILPGSKVLELGCGTGYFTREIVKTGAEIVAIDISPDLIDVAKDNIVASNLKYRVDNAYSMSFKDEEFDYVVGSSVLHHLKVNSAIAEIYRVLKRGGKIAFTEPNMMNPQIALQKNIPFIKRLAGDSPYEKAFFRRMLRKLFLKTGFQQVKIIPFDFLHPAVPRPLIGVISLLGNSLEKTPLIKEIAGSLFITAIK
ncbi:MAG: class I SAM-dependent methyltransferase [Bacteroidales bacterium]|nr:MAG: class I SAM-dependent methyltransferase [Bacteroidales bacterium]